MVHLGAVPRAREVGARVDQELAVLSAGCEAVFRLTSLDATQPGCSGRRGRPQRVRALCSQARRRLRQRCARWESHLASELCGRALRLEPDHVVANDILPLGQLDDPATTF